jgi:hypothetical protein|tara:strand:+ start:313 stop:546 length:234 start_codon:yes stop_codon:yes gene_type:complete
MMSKPIIKDEDWVYLYGELADYILEYSSLDPIWQTDDEGNEIAIRTEEKQDQFLDIADTVEIIMRKVLTKESEVNNE